MATNQALIHYALDLEVPPLIACEAPDAEYSSTVASDVTCPDCMTHEHFPQMVARPMRPVPRMPGVRPYNVLMSAADLLSEGENPEYDRAIVELTSSLIGAGPDDTILMTRILRALKQGE